MVDQEILSLIRMFMERLEAMSHRFSEDDKIMADKIADTNKNLALTSQALATMQTTHISCMALREKEVAVKAQEDTKKAEEESKNTEFRKNHELYGSFKMKLANIVGSIVLIAIGVLIEKYLR